MSFYLLQKLSSWGVPFYSIRGKSCSNLFFRKRMNCSLSFLPASAVRSWSHRRCLFPILIFISSLSNLIHVRIFFLTLWGWTAWRWTWRWTARWFWKRHRHWLSFVFLSHFIIVSFVQGNGPFIKIRTLSYSAKLLAPLVFPRRWWPFFFFKLLHISTLCQSCDASSHSE